jgi:hypothetical protein
MMHQLKQQHTTHNESDPILCYVHVLMQCEMKNQQRNLSRLNFGKENFEYDVIQ